MMRFDESIFKFAQGIIFSIILLPPPIIYFRHEKFSHKGGEGLGIRWIFLAVFRLTKWVTFLFLYTFFSSFLSNWFPIIPSFYDFYNYFQFSQVTIPNWQKIRHFSSFLFYGDRYLIELWARGTYQRSFCFGHANVHFAQAELGKLW